MKFGAGKLIVEFISAIYILLPVNILTSIKTKKVLIAPTVVFINQPGIRPDISGIDAISLDKLDAMVAALPIILIVSKARVILKDGVNKPEPPTLALVFVAITELTEVVSAAISELLSK
ncbi:MAG: hypothetical protein COC02_05430 [Rhodospirillaceae bacterium]|nr:MAG: hypothetical protein COC02_05430 [Rhodospirillaceae bacterium]